MEDHMARWVHGCRWKRGMVAGQIRKISNGWTKHSKKKEVHTTETIKMLARLHTQTYSHPYALKHAKISTHIYRKKYLTTGHTHYHMHKCTCANACKNTICFFIDKNLILQINCSTYDKRIVRNGFVRV